MAIGMRGPREKSAGYQGDRQQLASNSRRHPLRPQAQRTVHETLDRNETVGSVALLPRGHDAQKHGRDRPEGTLT
jgi:hypothetical protein